MRKVLLAIVVAGIAMSMAGGADAQKSKYKKYTKQSLSNLLLLCVEGDETGCYFYGGMQAKRGNYKEAHDAYLIGAQNAKSRAGFVSMFKLAGLYYKGKGVKKDLVQAYRWFDVVKSRQKSKDLRGAASGKLSEIGDQMTAKQISLARALSKTWVRIGGTETKKK